MLGQSREAIAGAIGMSRVRLNQIVASPLFQVEYRRRSSQRETQFVELEDKYLKVALMGLNLNEEILSDPKDTSGNAKYGIGLRADVAKTMTILTSKLISSPRGEKVIRSESLEGGEDGDDGQTYEEHLKRVTLEERVTRGKRGEVVVKEDDPEIRQLLGGMGEELPEEDIDEKDVIFGDVDGEVDEVDGDELLSVEEIVSQGEGR